MYCDDSKMSAYTSCDSENAAVVLGKLVPAFSRHLSGLPFVLHVRCDLITPAIPNFASRLRFKCRVKCWATGVKPLSSSFRLYIVMQRITRFSVFFTSEDQKDATADEE